MDVDQTIVCHGKVYGWQRNELIKDIDRNQYEGIGKPEPLRHSLSGFWSRRINEEYRLVYHISEDEIHIAQLRYHY